MRRDSRWMGLRLCTQAVHKQHAPTWTWCGDTQHSRHLIWGGGKSARTLAHILYTRAHAGAGRLVHCAQGWRRDGGGADLRIGARDRLGSNQVT